MKNKNISLSLITLLVFIVGCQNNSDKDKTAKKSAYDKEIRALLSKMTLDEKIGQLNMVSGDWSVTGPVVKTNFIEDIKNGKVGTMLNAYTAKHARKLMQLSVDSTRLGIPLLLGYDVIHGHRTIFPIPLGESCTWDLKLIEKSAQIAAEEASAEGIHWTFAPMVDIARDPRWGRVMEGAGEDPWLGSKIAEAKVKGFQGVDLSKNNTILACVKHVAAYGAPIAGRDYNTVDLSERTLFESYLPPYKAAVEAGVETAMTAFNEINGIPCTSNHWLWEDLMRNQWGFDGFVVTDYTATMELIKHGVAKDLYDASVLAFNAGVDEDMVSQGFLAHLEKAVENGDVTEERIDQSVYRILKAKFELGLFEDPYRYCDTVHEQEVVMTKEKVEFARKVGHESCVLLKNKNVLPFSKNIKSIAVIGPLADSKEDMIGAWTAAGDRYNRPVTLLEGIKNILSSSVKIRYAKGTDYNSWSKNGFREAIKAAKKSDVVILALGENWQMSSEAQSRSIIDLPGNQNELAEAIIKANKNTAVVLMNGRPLTIQRLDNIAPAILETWYAGTEAGNAIADLLFGDYNPSGKLTMTFPRNVGQIPIFYNHKNTGRPFNPDDHYTTKYIDVPNTPLYNFGHGLSYTTFKFGEVTLDKNKIAENDTLKASVTLKNIGKYGGAEVVQLYIRDLIGSVTRPVKELKGFEKVYLKKGESQTVSFLVGKEELSFYRKDMSYGTEPGEFEILIGNSSATKNKASFILE